MCRIKLLWVAAVALLVTGCLRDDLSDCEQGIGLIFEYTHHHYEADLFGAEVKQITVFVFNSSGIYTETFSCKINDMVNNEFSLPLPKGTHTLITLGGTLEFYTPGETNEENKGISGLKKGITSIEKFRVQMQENNHPSDLYYNQTKVEVIPGQKTSYPINLIKNSSLVRFLIKEISENSSGVMIDKDIELSYNIHLSGNNTRIDSENNIAADAPIYSHPALAMGSIEPENSHQTDYRMMRLMKEHPVELKIEDKATGVILLEENLTELILQNSTMYKNQSDLDKEDLFLIELDIARQQPGATITVTVRVNGWTIIKTKPVL